jgi:gliding motility-associated lipoprotein GldH
MTSLPTKPNRKISKHPAAAPAISLLAILLLSCTGTVVYHQYQPTDGEFWGKDEVCYFTFRIHDASVPYNISFEVRSNNLYPYRNLWVFCSEEPPAGPLRRDTLECMLADEYGKWHGKGISLHQLEIPLRTRHIFPMPGQYTFAFRHAMRDDSIRGIRETGLRVERAVP